MAAGTPSRTTAPSANNSTLEIGDWSQPQTASGTNAARLRSSAVAAADPTHLICRRCSMPPVR